MTDDEFKAQQDELRLAQAHPLRRMAEKLAGRLGEGTSATWITSDGSGWETKATRLHKSGRGATPGQAWASLCEGLLAELDTRVSVDERLVKVASRALEEFEAQEMKTR
jgi:hypothetical protein